MSSTPFVPELGILIQNDSGETIPPRSVVVVTSVEIVPVDAGMENATIHHATKYTGQHGNIYVTGSVALDPQPLGTSPPYLSGRATGTAYSDQFIYVAIDADVTNPLAGEQWGPVPNTWTVSRGGCGFFCQGYAVTGASSQRAMFLRDRGFLWGKLTSDLPSGSMCAPSTATFNVWNADPDSDESPVPYIETDTSGLLGLTVVNRDANISPKAGQLIKVEWNNEWSIYWVGTDRSCSSSSSSATSSSSTSTSASGSTSSSAPAACIQVVTSVTCYGGGLVVGYGSAAACGS